MPDQPSNAAMPVVEPIRFQLLAAVPGLCHGVTRREGPGLAGNLSFTRGPDAASVLAARARWCHRIGVDPAALVFVRQVHGATVEQVTVQQRGRGALQPASSLPAADAMTTDAPGVALVALAADCVPVLLIDPVRRAAAAVHAGWRGTVAGVVGATVAAMTARYGSRPTDLLAGIGPSIGPCCYEVGPEVAAATAPLGDAILQPGRRPNHPHLNLWSATRQALLRAGLLAEHIELAGLCTRCHVDQFFSHRAEGPSRGLFGAIICLDEAFDGASGATGI
jgi:YfiH family protein